MAEQDLHREDDAAPEGARHSRAYRSARQGGRALGWVFAALLFVLAVVILVLQTNWGRGQVEYIVLKRLNAMFDGAELTADRLAGNIIGNFVLTDVNLIKTDGERLAHVDTLSADYNLLSLLRNQLVLSDVDLVRPSIWMEQQSDSTWDLFQVIARDDSVAVDTAETYWTSLVIRLDELTVADGYWQAAFYAPGRDSILTIRDLNTDLADARFGGNPVFEVQALSAEFQPPGQDYWGQAYARGTLADSSLALSALRIRTPETYVASRGTLRLPTQERAYVDDVDFALVANPLTFGDIRPFVPGLNAQGRVDVLMEAKGSGRQLVIDADASFSLGGTLALDGAITTGTDGPVSYTLDGELRRLNPATILGPSTQPGLLNADLHVDLEGTQVAQLTGELNATILNSAYGAYNLERAVLTSTWNDGVADFELATGLRGASIAAEGTARPFADVISYDFTARVGNLNLGRFMEGSSMTSNLAGTLTVEGQGLDLATAEIDAGVRLAPSTVNDYPIEDAALDLRLADGDLAFGARVLVPEGRLVAEGGVQFGDVMEYRISRGEFANFDIAAFMGPDAGPSSFTGTFSLQGRGTDVETLSTDFNVNLANGSFGDIAIADAGINGSLRNGLLTAAADVDLEGSGFFDLAVSARPFRDPAVATIERGIFRNVNLAQLLGNPELETDLSGAIAGSLRGFDPATMAFDGRIDLDPSRINQQQISDATLLADLNGGTLDFTLSLATPEGQTRLAGTAQPFLDVPTYVVRDGQFQSLNIGALLGRPNLTTNLSGNLSVRGRGIDPETLTLQATVDLNPSRINEQIVNDAVLTVEMQGGNLDFIANLDLPEGDTRLAGEADLLAANPSFRITEGQFVRFNVGALLGLPNWQTELTGSIDFSAQGFDPATGNFQGAVRLENSRINRQVIEEATLDADLRQGMLDFDLVVLMPEGLVRLDGVAQVNADPISYDITQGYFENINLGPLLGNPDLDTDLTGGLTLQGRGLDPETMNLQGAVRLAESRINEQALDTAIVEIGLDAGNLEYAAFLDTPVGESRLVGTAQPFLDEPVYAVDEGVVEGLDVSALLGMENRDIVLTGNLTLDGRGFDPETMYLDVQADLTHATLNEAEVISADIQALLDNGLLRLDSDVILDEGRAQINAAVQPFLDRPTYDIAGTLVNVDVGGILGTDTLRAEFNADLEIVGAGLDPETMTIQGIIRANSSEYQDIAVDSLYTNFRLDDGLLELDALYLRSNIADATGEGQIALFDTTGTQNTDIEFDAYVKDIEPLQELIGADALAIGEGRIAGRAFGREGNIQFDVNTDISRFVYNDIRFSGLEGRVSGTVGPDRKLRLGEVNASFDFLAVPGLALQGSNFEISYEGDDIVFQGDVVIDERRAATVQGRADLRPDSRALTLENFTLAFEDDTWQLLQPATISLQGQYRISNFLLYSDDQQIAIDGVIDPNGEQNLIVTIETFRLETVTDLIGYEGVSGTLTGSLLMSGPAYAPNLEGSLQLDSLASGDKLAGDMNVDLSYDDLRLNIDALLRNVDQGTLAVEGFVPLDLRLATADSVRIAEGAQVQGLQLRTENVSVEEAVQLTIDADSFSIGWLEPFLSPESVQNLAGTLQADITVTGTLDQPVLAGDLQLTQGQFNLVDIETNLRDITAIGTLENSIVQLEQLHIRSGDGTLEGQGTIQFAQLNLGAFDIQLELDNFLAADNDDYQDVRISGTPRLSGTLTSPVLFGDLEVDQAEIYLDNVIAPSFELVPLTQRDLNMLEEVFGYSVTEEDTTTFVLFDALSLNLSLNVSRNAWLMQRSNPEMSIQFTGRVDVVKQAYADLEVFGTIDVIPERSYVDQFGKRFDITSGTISVNGPLQEFTLDLEAEYTVRSRVAGEPEVVITLGIDGEYGNLELTLGSDPPMSNTDIVSYIATGQQSGFAIDQVGSQLAFGQLTSLVEAFAGEELGLDVVEIEYDLQGGTQLVVGEYVSNGLFVAVSQAFGDAANSPVGQGPASGTQFEIEYEIMDWLLLRFVGGRTSLRLNLLYEQAY